MLPSFTHNIRSRHKHEEDRYGNPTASQVFLLTLSFLSFFRSRPSSFPFKFHQFEVIRFNIEGWRWQGGKTSTAQTEIQQFWTWALYRSSAISLASEDLLINTTDANMCDVLPCNIRPMCGSNLRVFTFDIRWTLNRVWVCDLCRVHGTREVLTFVILSLAALVSDRHRPDKRDIFTYPNVTAACQSLQLFRLLLQRCPLADSNSCMSLRVSIVLHWSEPHVGGGGSKVTASVTFMVQGHAVIELHCHHNLVYSLSNAHGDNLAQVGWFTRMYLLILWHFWTNISDSSVGTVDWAWHLHESRGSRTLSHC